MCCTFLNYKPLKKIYALIFQFVTFYKNYKNHELTSNCDMVLKIKIL